MDATETCSRYEAVLPVIRNATENEALHKLLSDLEMQQTFLGGKFTGVTLVGELGGYGWEQNWWVKAECGEMDVADTTFTDDVGRTYIRCSSSAGYSWLDATETCSRYEAVLPVIRNATENEALHKLLSDLEMQQTFLGGKFTGVTLVGELGGYGWEQNWWVKAECGEMDVCQGKETPKKRIRVN